MAKPNENNLKSREPFTKSIADAEKQSESSLNLHDIDVKTLSVEERLRRIENILAGRDLWK